MSSISTTTEGTVELLFNNQMLSIFCTFIVFGYFHVSINCLTVRQHRMPKFHVTYLIVWLSSKLDIINVCRIKCTLEQNSI